MIKKVLFVIVLALQAAAIVNIAVADSPYPNCMPCPSGTAR